MKTNNQIENSSSFIALFINTLLLLVITIMPFIVFPFGKYYYINTKVIFLYTCGILIFLLMIIDRKIEIKKEYLFTLLFLESIFIASIFSNYKDIAFLGSPNRQEGFLMYLVYIILFIAASKYLIINKVTINIILSCSCIMSIYTILQMFEIDPIQKYLYNTIVTPDGINGSIGSIGTIGNYNFVSSYICMFLFISIGIYIFKNKKIYLIPSIILFMGLLATRTRGGWVSFAIVSCIGILFIIRKKEYYIRTLALLGALVISFFTINYFSDNKILDRANISNLISETSSTDNVTYKNSYTSTKAQNIKIMNKTDTENSINLVGSASSRANILRIGFNAFLDSPFLGEGPDTLFYRLNDQYKEEMNYHISQYNESIDKLHNEYLEYAVCDGLFTLIFYLLIIGIILYRLVKNFNSTTKIVFFTILIYLVQAFTNISVIMVAPLFWILLGYASKISSYSSDL